MEHRSLLASLPHSRRAPAELGGLQLCQPQNSPGLEDEAVVTFGARHAGVSPQIYGCRASAGAGAPREQLLSNVQPQEDPKSQKSPWWKGKGMAGLCGVIPCLASAQQSRGKASRAPLPADELPNPRNSSKPQTTAPQTDAAHGSWHSQGWGPTDCLHCCLPPTLSKYPSSAPQSFTSQLCLSHFLLTLGW